MTERMQQAGIAAYAQHRGEDPEQLVAAIYAAICDEKQKEALENYWKLYR